MPSVLTSQQTVAVGRILCLTDQNAGAEGLSVQLAVAGPLHPDIAGQQPNLRSHGQGLVPSCLCVS